MLFKEMFEIAPQLSDWSRLYSRCRSRCVFLKAHTVQCAVPPDQSELWCLLWFFTNIITAAQKWKHLCAEKKDILLLLCTYSSCNLTSILLLRLGRMPAVTLSILWYLQSCLFFNIVFFKQVVWYHYNESPSQHHLVFFFTGKMKMSIPVCVFDSMLILC